MERKRIIPKFLKICIKETVLLGGRATAKFCATLLLLWSTQQAQGFLPYSNSVCPAELFLQRTGIFFKDMLLQLDDKLVCFGSLLFH